MNNPNNSNRVVINLDGDLDDLDDDDITLPSLPAQSVAIIDETEETRYPKMTIEEESIDGENKPITTAINKQVSSSDATESIALGAPIIMAEKHSTSESTSESFLNTNKTEGSISSVSAPK